MRGFLNRRGGTRLPQVVLIAMAAACCAAGCGHDENAAHAEPKRATHPATINTANSGTTSPATTPAAPGSQGADTSASTTDQAVAESSRVEESAAPQLVSPAILDEAKRQKPSASLLRALRDCTAVDPQLVQDTFGRVEPHPPIDDSATMGHEEFDCNYGADWGYGSTTDLEALIEHDGRVFVAGNTQPPPPFLSVNVSDHSLVAIGPGVVVDMGGVGPGISREFLEEALSQIASHS